MSFLIDTYSEPTDAELAMPGCAGALRYISHDSGKCVTRWQVDHIHALGRNVCLNFEDTAEGPLNGYGQGRADAQFAISVARNIGAPAGVAIFYSIDVNVQGAQYGAVEEYMRGVHDEHAGTGFPVGVYGKQPVEDVILAEGRAVLGWETAAWSGGVLSRDPRTVLYQDQFNQGFDVDEIEHPYYGGWTPTGPQGDDDMTPEQAAQLDALYKRVASIDTMAFNIDGDQKTESLRAVLNDIRTSLQQIAAKVGA